MKKILKRVFIVLASLIIVLIAAASLLTVDWSRIKRQSASQATAPTGVDPAGNPYSIVVDTDGVTYAAVQDDQGNIWQRTINGDGSLGETVASLNDYLSPSDVVGGNLAEPSQQGDVSNKQSESVSQDGFANHPESTVPADTTAESKKENGKNRDSSDEKEATTSDSGEAPTTENPGTETTPTSKQLNFERYRDMYSSGTYLMVFTTNDEDLGDAPITSAKKGKNIRVTTTIEGMTGTIIYLGDTDKTYFVVDEMKKYFSLSKKLLGDDMDMSQMDMISGFFSDDIDASKFKTESETVDGKKLTVESYKMKDSGTRKYYFDGDTLVRIDSIDEQGEVSSFFIQSVTNEVPDSTFEIPEGYGYLNLSWLL